MRTFALLTSLTLLIVVSARRSYRTGYRVGWPNVAAGRRRNQAEAAGSLSKIRFPGPDMIAIIYEPATREYVGSVGPAKIGFDREVNYASPISFNMRPRSRFSSLSSAMSGVRGQMRLLPAEAHDLLP